MMEKKTYYIEIANGEISQSGTDSPWNFKIEATEEEILALREYFDQDESDEISNFIRAHIPFREYHLDKENDVQDENLQQIYRMIHQLGDQDTKKHIESMGFLDHI